LFHLDDLRVDFEGPRFAIPDVAVVLQRQLVEVEPVERVVSVRPPEMIVERDPDQRVSDERGAGDVEPRRDELRFEPAIETCPGQMRVRDEHRVP
jgi:hypothetical protein